VKEVRARRKTFLQNWAKANGCEGPDELLNKILLDGPNAVTPYSTARAFIDSLREKEQALTTIRQTRSMLPGFFESVLGEENFKRTVFDRLVPMEESPVETEKKAPTKEELRHLLNVANPRDRALLGVLCTGMRISEAISRKLSEIEPLDSEARVLKDKDTKRELRGIHEEAAFYRIRLGAQATKSRYARHVYLTKETAAWIENYHAGIQSQWIFPGGEGRFKPKDRVKGEDHHMTKVAAWDSLKKLFHDGGLDDTDTEIYSPHSMRKFSENYMLTCGLPDKFTDQIIGHGGKLGAKGSYKDWDATAQAWFTHCDEKMTWLQSEITVIRPDPQTQRRLEHLEEQLSGFKELGKILGDKRLTLEEKVQTLLRVLNPQPQIEDRTKPSVEKP
jgi:integrase